MGKEDSRNVYCFHSAEPEWIKTGSNSNPLGTPDSRPYRSSGLLRKPACRGSRCFFQVGYQANEGMVTITSGVFSHSGPFGHIDLDRIAKTIARYELPTGV